MAIVYLGLGSNIERERYIVAGLDALQRQFGELQLSSVYDCPAIGFDGQPFLNLVAQVETELPVGELFTQLRRLEFEHGRPKNAQRYSARQLDIDILTYDEKVGMVDGVELPREEILHSAFVLRPLAELAPNVIHPQKAQTYSVLWSRFSDTTQPTRRVSFGWRGRQISLPE